MFASQGSVKKSVARRSGRPEELDLRLAWLVLARGLGWSVFVLARGHGDDNVLALFVA